LHTLQSILEFSVGIQLLLVSQGGLHYNTSLVPLIWDNTKTIHQRQFLNVELDHLHQR
jgi:hypothetical protein